MITNIFKMMLVGATAFGVSGCADKADEIGAAYVSPMHFQAMSCQQLAAEAQGTSARAQNAFAAQDKRASSDAVAVGVGTILFWPALFMIKGDGAHAAEVARLKGEMQAIEAVNRSKSCGLALG
ncbi:hypothetical protein [Paracoccus tibetensis]|uniref:Lipoprotein n=1 Tax=Paracoccus tibetensis TaxID=336292 RepID=A0A1G5IYV1_9RHOB|nr:hypothetical protein [Paracoccus tibetensis]SCY80598.1 hypothetical protein SAMN05660710_02838 [Paracoccus tibetensis]